MALSAPVVAAPTGDTRLVEACQVAVGVHANGVALDFPAAWRDGDAVHLDFSFAQHGRGFDGQAHCRFRANALGDLPPSLVDLEVMGRIDAGRFLVSHQAVWAFFTGRPIRAEVEVPGEDIEPAPRPDATDEGRRMRAGARAPEAG